MRFDSFDRMTEYWAGLRPDGPALRYEDRTMTFSELRDAVIRRSEELASSGKRCVAVAAETVPECVVEIFAANRAGMQVVMLDPSLPDELLNRLIAYTDADMVWSSDPDLLEELSPLPVSPIKDSSDRILFFTSGTTSSSKAVVLTGRSLCSSAWNGSEKLPLSTEDTLLAVLPLAHVFGFVCGLLWGLSCGSCVALGTGPRGYISDFASYRPTAVSVVPLLLGFLLKNGALNDELSTLLIGAGDCPPELLGAAKAKGLSVSFGYGLTETSSGVAISTSGDPFAMEICPEDTITIAEDGEVLIQAPTCMMQGYYKDPASTAEVLRDGVLSSGDLGYLDAEGRLHITGRKKDMLVLPDGTKIFLPEYEARIASVLGTSEFSVDLRGGRPVLIMPEGTEGPAGAMTKADIIQKLRPVTESLPRGQQITDVIFTEGPLPRTATGKLKRWEIRQKVGLS